MKRVLVIFTLLIMPVAWGVDWRLISDDVEGTLWYIDKDSITGSPSTGITFTAKALYRQKYFTQGRQFWYSIFKMKTTCQDAIDTEHMTIFDTANKVVISAAVLRTNPSSAPTGEKTVAAYLLEALCP